MTETERLRELLNERGVEYETLSFYDATWWKDACGLEWYYGEDDDGHTIIEALDLTPEQAIAATLGRKPDDDAMVKLHDQMNAVLLEYERAQGIERRDGDGEIVVPFVAEMHRLLEEAATLESGTCHMKEVNLPTFGGHDDGYFIVCS